MSRFLRSILIGMTGMTAAYAFADQLEEHDPVRVAQRLKDCVAQNLAMHDGRTHTAIRQACKKAIAEGSYQDPNIGLDGMIKSSPPQRCAPLDKPPPRAPASEHSEYTQRIE
jgi:hypothetical protein